MSCSSCSYDKGGTPTGCGDKGHCTSGSCNKMNAYDWLTTLDIHDPLEFGLVEVSFKKGSRKEFFINPEYTRAITGDMVVIDSGNGYDVGRISLSGELVRAQMKKKKVNEDRIIHKVIRIANEHDLEKLSEVREKEKSALVKSRVIARTLNLDMKIGDIEYQGDGRKVTIYYTADGRVDFRELVKQYAREFRVKIEMRQIGARQESARIGGLGACGRELCCSTWLSDFKSVTTSAARYQNIAINQTKLSGQCGRLKCCLNYELDSYLDAIKDFPDKVEKLTTKKGRASLIKTDIFKGLFFYSYDDRSIRGPMIAVPKERVKEIKAMNEKGEHPLELIEYSDLIDKVKDENKELEFADVTGEIELPSRNKRTKRKPRSNRTKTPDNSQEDKSTESKSENNNPETPKKPSNKRNRNKRNRGRNFNNKNNNNTNNNNDNKKD
jgi:cell fate regulator YaaT (PSP1 superfamily)